MTTEVLNSMENVKCNEVAVAMFAFPRITLSKKAIEAAKVSCLISVLISSAAVQNTVSNGYPRCTVIRSPESGNFLRVESGRCTVIRIRILSVMDILGAQ